MIHAPLSLRPGAGAVTNTCTKCGKTQPIDAFDLLSTGGHRRTCKTCRSAARNERKRARRAAWKETPHYREHLARKQRERDARALASECHRAEQGRLRAAESAARKDAERAAKSAATAERRAKAKAAADRRATRRALEEAGGPEAAAARVVYLAAILAGATTKERLETDAGWEATMTELQRLWLVSGDKTCARCKGTFPPEQVLAPSPGVSYPGHSRQSPRREYEGHLRETFGPLIGPLPGPRRLPMRDGTYITIAELGRRHREWQAGYRIKRLGR